MIKCKYIKTIICTLQGNYGRARATCKVDHRTKEMMRKFQITTEDKTDTLKILSYSVINTELYK